MLMSPLIFKIERHVIYQKIALCDIYLLMYFCIARLIKRTEDIASIYFNFLGYVFHSPPEGRVSQNVDLGPG